MAWSLRVPPGSEERLPLTPALGVLGEETEVPSGPARGLCEAETYWLAAGGQTHSRVDMPLILLPAWRLPWAHCWPGPAVATPSCCVLGTEQGQSLAASTQRGCAGG